MYKVRTVTPRTLFRRQNPCPSTGKTTGACPGYSVHHIIPLRKGGADDPHNMQWQVRQVAKPKPKVDIKMGVGN
ncbi:MAG: HNH endonuclease [Magnetococcales bacterium]|nr:HNH endonuclease [Magnetococcales bacterium]MBF0323105.1 HNH endonuclease [Magnetococcales bacterium]